MGTAETGTRGSKLSQSRGRSHAAAKGSLKLSGVAKSQQREDSTMARRKQRAESTAKASGATAAGAAAGKDSNDDGATEEAGKTAGSGKEGLNWINQVKSIRDSQGRRSTSKSKSKKAKSKERSSNREDPFVDND